MQPFYKLTGIAAPLPMVNVDTDMIIPAKWLKTITRTGLASGLFETLRYGDDGSTERPDFILNREPYRRAKILIADSNFGCGSSREHAPWALLDFGIRCLVAPSFADIFHSNCYKNGILPVVLPRDQVDVLLQEAVEAPDPTYSVDLESQELRSPTGGRVFSFSVDPGKKRALMNGLDDIGQTMERSQKIDEFEARQRASQPWLHDEVARG